VKKLIRLIKLVVDKLSFANYGEELIRFIE